MTFLSIGGGDLDGARLPHYSPLRGLPQRPYTSQAALPIDAEDTGYQRGGGRLWLAPDYSRAFVGTADSVAVWPRTIQPLGCA